MCHIHFVFQVLFKNLGVDMKDITPTSLLENRPRQVEGNPDFSNKDIGASHPPMISEVKSAIVSTPNKVELPVEVASPHTGGHTHLLSQVSICLIFLIWMLAIMISSFFPPFLWHLEFKLI